MSSSTIIIQEPQDLESFDPVERHLLERLPRFEHYLNRIKRHYQEFLEDPTRQNRPYQPRYAAIACCRRLNLWGHAMSVGKTSEALLVIQGLYAPVSDRRPGYCHIMVPGILAAQRWLEDSSRIPSLVGQVELIRNERDLLAATAPILVYSYDFPKLRSKTLAKTSRPYCSRLLYRRFAPVLTIVDEIHNVCPGTQRYTHVEYLRHKSRRFLGLSGTLSDGNLSQIHNVCRLVYQDYWPYRTAQQFSRHFGQKERVQSHFLGHHRPQDSKDKTIQRLSIPQMPEYYNLARRFIHRVRLDDPEVACCITVPKSKIETLRVLPTAEQQQQFLEYVALHRTEMEAASKLKDLRYRAAALTLLNPLILLTNAWPHDTPKKQAVLSIIQNAPGKTVVFCDSVAAARCIHQYLAQHFDPASVVRLYGTDHTLTPATMPQDDRVDLINRFQFDSTVKAAVLSINLTAQAIDLTAASDVVMYCLPWSSLKVQQALARAVRCGNQHKVVQSHYLYQHGLIDEHKVNVMVQKIQGSRLLLDYEIDDVDGEDESEDLTPADIIKKILAG